VIGQNRLSYTRQKQIKDEVAIGHRNIKQWTMRRSPGLRPKNTSGDLKLLISIKLLYRKSLKAKAHKKRVAIVEDN
jgi:hypothetical protein